MLCGWPFAILGPGPLRWQILSIVSGFGLALNCCHFNVPARLRKGQGAKEIGHNIAPKQPKFGHNLVRKRQKNWHSLEHERPSLLRANAQNSGTI